MKAQEPHPSQSATRMGHRRERPQGNWELSPNPSSSGRCGPASWGSGCAGEMPAGRRGLSAGFPQAGWEEVPTPAPRSACPAWLSPLPRALSQRVLCLAPAGSTPQTATFTG